LKPVARYALIGVGAMAALALAIAGASRILERQHTAAEINRLREDLYRARAAADRCRNSLVNSESSLRQLGLTIDSLRSRVDSFESLDSRGVPADRYEQYMESFDGYNDSVAVWEGRERNLRAAEGACRATIEEHNALSDTLQRVLGEAGIEAG
jgi:hypothetical protein